MLRFPSLRLPRKMVLAFLCLMLVWLLLVAAAYRATTPAQREALSPNRLRAIAEAIESADDPGPVMAALSAPGLRLTLAGGGLDPALERLPQSRLGAYERALAPRQVTAGSEPVFGIGRLLRRPFRGEMSERTVFEISLNDGAQLLISRSDTPELSSAGLPFGLLVGFLGTAIAAAMVVLTIREARPVLHLARAVEDLAPGEIAHLPDPRGSSREFGDLIRAFDRMQNRLAQVMAARNTLISGISHDVRSFATRLRLRTAFIPDAAERARAESDIDDMIRLLEDALLLGRAETKDMRGALIRPGAIARQIAQDRARTGDDVRFEGNAEVSVLGDGLAMRRILQNGIDNALRFAGQVRVSTTVEPDRILVTLDDDGPGIPATQRAEMLEPFTRLEGSRSRATGGAGLGLAIMRQLAEAQGGSMTIEDSPSGGTRIAIAFPHVDYG